jgi:hypothetical protein
MHFFPHFSSCSCIWFRDVVLVVHVDHDNRNRIQPKENEVFPEVTFDVPFNEYYRERNDHKRTQCIPNRFEHNEIALFGLMDKNKNIVSKGIFRNRSFPQIAFPVDFPRCKNA